MVTDLPSLAPIGEWRTRGRCGELIRAGEARAEWWYPERPEPGDTPEEREAKVRGPKWAKAICRECPVRVECLAHAMTGEKYGIWGGLSPKERREEVSYRFCAECGTRFPTLRGPRPLCSDACRAEARRRTQRRSRLRGAV